MRTLLFTLLTGIISGYLTCGASELVIVGNNDVPRETILSAASSACSEPDSACVRAMCKAVAEYYWENGYLDLDIACERLRPASDTVLVSITEGRVSRLRSVEILGSEAFGASALERTFDDRVGRPFSGAALERGIVTLLEFYDDHGFPAAGIRPETISSEEGWVEVTLRVDEGRRATIGRVIFEGLTGTRREVLLAESGIREGSPYDGGRIAEAGPRLMALGIFETVSEPVLSFGAGDSIVAVSFEVVEARTNRVEGVMAYAPSQEDGQLVGSLDLEFGNIAGTLRRLRVFYDRAGSDRLRWSIAYREPRLAGTPVALDVGLSSDVIESSFARRKLTMGLRFRGAARLELGLGGILGVTKDRSGGSGEGDFGERGVSFDLRYEGRDRPSNPLSGALLAFSHEVVALDFDSQEVRDRTLSSLEAEAEYIVGVTGGTVVALGSRFKGAFASSGPVPQSHVFRLGGAGSLRGYPEEWFSVREALVITLEARQVLGGSSRVYAFIDGATLEDRTREFGDLDDFPFGYGFGFMGGARSGVFRLEVALGRDDGISDAKLHLGLVQRF
jgi:outer membrane protein assembly factor BamA